MADIRIRLLAGELLYPSGSFPDLDTAMAVTRAEMDSFMGGEYDGEVAVLHLAAAYDPEPEPSIPEVPDPREQVGLSPA